MSHAASIWQSRQQISAFLLRFCWSQCRKSIRLTHAKAYARFTNARSSSLDIGLKLLSLLKTVVPNLVTHLHLFLSTMAIDAQNVLALETGRGTVAYGVHADDIFM